MRKINKIYLSILILLISFSGVFLEQTGIVYAARPADCKTEVSGMFDSSDPTIYKQCAELSPVGYTLNLYYGDTKNAGGEKEFQFIGNTDYGVLGTGDIGQWVYRSTSAADQSNKFYLALANPSNTVRETHHYRVGTNKEWDQFATAEDNITHYYSIISTQKKLPSYMGNDAKDSNGKRFVWRLVINGNVKLFGKSLADSSAKRGDVMLAYDEANGPTLDLVPTDTDGGFEFSRGYAAGQGVGNEELWVNAGTYINDPGAPDATIGTPNAEADAKIKSAGTVTKLFLYVQVETESGDKFEKVVPISLATDFRFHKDHQDTLVDTTIGDINIVSDNKVTDFSRGASGEQSTIKEALGFDACGNSVDFSMGHAITSAFCSLGVMLNNFAVNLLKQAFDMLKNSLGLS